ncbi:dihydrofolate reductase family protein [Nocardiopsis composta]|uniref:Dihydrofolate reductase n=1 Tax=Nocardiopsis composta TaxID=157465 RepID=A0A7W8QHI8_9ACTN|nr:dihydrofolate reductase family protein [Nocardiopsis composta]MBB5430139.1 dihydrofolate reductase [Nocardiopsis composta]
MGEIVYFAQQSVDGFIEGPEGEFDWPAVGPELSEYSRAAGEQAGAFLYGRVVWEMMSGFWPRAEELSDDPHDLAFAPAWRAKPKLVVSRTLQGAEWNTRVLADLDELAAAKKEAEGDIVLFGGSELAAALTERGLIDEYRLIVHPVALGGGKRAFADPGRLGLELSESRVFDGTAVLLRYRR